MLGCKSDKIKSASYRYYRINRYMLGCKYGSGGGDFDISELIDTCWDVNIAGAMTVASVTSELIDTCWDVNTWDGFVVR